MKSLNAIIEILIIAILVVIASSCNDSNKYTSKGLTYTLNIDNQSYSVSTGTNKSKNVAIPSLYNNLPVTQIATDGFISNENLESISIPNTVIIINNFSFQHIEKLKNVIFEGESQLQYIGIGAFSGCVSLIKFDFPSSLEFIDEEAFLYCINLEEVIFNDDSQLNTIRRAAFMCESLQRVYLPKSLVSLDSTAFSECGSLTEIKVDSDNSNFKTIDDNLLSYDETILLLFPAGKIQQEYTIPKGILIIGEYAFYGNKNLTEITISNSVMEISRNAFGKCLRLQKVNFEENSRLTTIGVCGFVDSFRLSTISLPSSVTTLENSVFSRCVGLKTIVIPNTIEFIGSSAFGEWRDDQVIYMDFSEASKKWYDEWYSSSSAQVIWSD